MRNTAETGKRRLLRDGGDGIYIVSAPRNLRNDLSESPRRAHSPKGCPVPIAVTEKG